MLDDALLASWCARHLGSPYERVLFRSGFLSEVVGVELADGRRVVVKARPSEPRIAGCVQVQTALARAGFPCPEPLTGVTRLDGLTVTAEVEVAGGEPRPADPGAAPYAALLAGLVVAAPDPAEVASLAPSPAWAGWDHPGRRLWPDLDEHGQDLNLVVVPAWVDDVASRVRERLTASRSPLVVAHGDWEPQNLRWTGPDPLVVHDWDSVLAQPEAAVVGLAAAMWTRDDGSAPISTLAETADFIAAYRSASARAWTPAEEQDAWAAGLWLGLVFATQDAAEGGDEHLAHLARDLDERLHRAGLA